MQQDFDEQFESFLAPMLELTPEHARVLGCQFRGDPNENQPYKWRARVVNTAASVDPLANVYLCVSAMNRGEDGKFRRRKENFAAGLLLMIDDLGSGPGAKFPLSTVDALPPTGFVETSPDNFQAIYLFDAPVTDAALFQALIDAFIREQFLDGKDPGMAGINRVFRPPIGVNGKPKYGGDFRVRLSEWDANRRFTPEGIASAFNLDLTPPPRRLPRIPAGGVDFAIAQFERILAELKECGMVKHATPTAQDWLSILCPWTAEHTGGVDNGAAVRMPNPENGWNGGFKCHHGACEARGWRELTDWVAEEQFEALDAINASAPEGMT